MAARKRENAFDLPKLDEYFTTQEQRDDAKLKKIHEIPLEEIDEFPDHPFKVKGAGHHHSGYTAKERGWQI